MDLVVEVADVTDDGLVLHFRHVLDGDDIHVARCCDVDIAAAQRLFDGGDFVTFHRGLESVDRIDLGDDDAGALAAEGLRAAFSDVAVSADDGDFAGDHDVDRAIDAVDERMAAAVEVVELRFGDRVVHVERGNQQLAQLLEFVEAMHAGSRLFGDAAPFLHDLVENEGISAVDLLEEILDDFLLVASAWRVHPIVSFFELIAFVEQERHVAAVIDDELRAFAFAIQDRLPCAIPVFLERLALPGEDRHAGFRDGRGGVILRREDVATRPAHRGAELDRASR